MERHALLEALSEITGTWSSPAGPAALTEARRAIADSLLSGAAAQDISPAARSRAPLTPSSPASLETLQSLLAGLPPPAAPAVRPFVRSALGLDPGARGAVAGMKIERTLGPFVDVMGIEHFVDLLPIPRKYPIEGPSGALALLILDTTPVPRPGPIKLGAGSIWIAVSALAGGAAAGFVGLEFSEGSAELVNVHAGPGGSLVLKPGSKLTLRLTLVHKAPPAPPPGVIGADAAALKVTPPSQVALLLEAVGAEFTALEDALATLYDSSFVATRNAAKPRVRDYGTPYLLVPCDVSVPSFAIGSCASTDFIVSGSAPVKAGGWVLPVATTPPADLGVPDGAGGLALELGPGITASFGGLTEPALLADIAFLLHPATITVTAHTGKRELHERLLLWGPPPEGAQKALPPPIRRVSELDLTYARGAQVTVTITPGSEIVIVACSASANLDRPLSAHGARLPLAYTKGFAGFLHDSAGKRALAAVDTPPQTERGHVLALENALAGTGASTVLAFLGTRAGPAWVGNLGVAFPLRGIVPSLPDPYAASFPFQQLVDRAASGSLAALMTWTAGATPNLNFSASGLAIPMQAGFTLLDVSTNADQFGVSALTSDAPAFSIHGLALETGDRSLAVYALPGISWEPIVKDVAPAPVDWLDAFSNDDGPATMLRTASVDLVRVEPAIALPHFQETANKAVTFADFTLPFGVMAHLSTGPQTDPRLQPTFQLNDSHYKDDLRNGLQLSIIANPNSFIPHAPPDGSFFSGPALPGYATTGSPPLPPDPSIYGIQVLGAANNLDPAWFFDQQFSQGGSYPGIPVTRIDLSGYGTNMFSDWHHEDITKVGVVRARFEVMIGRTAYEMLVLQTIVGCWCFRMTRTLLFDRYNTGLVVKHDTGWKPVGLAKFELLTPTNSVIPGAMVSFSNIHNVVVSPGPVITAKNTPPRKPFPLQWAPVTFDADLNLDFAQCSVSANGKSNVPVACTRVGGYAQLTVGDVASSDEILDLMDQIGPAGHSGNAGCILSVGALAPGTPQFTLNVSSIQASATSARGPGVFPAAVAVALNGTPRLPRDGAWSVAKRPRTSTVPTAVSSTTPIPLVRARGATPQWRLLDPVDAASPNSPATFYSVLQGAGTAKTLFEHAVIDDSGKSINMDPGRPPNLADVGALLGATGIFPDLGAILPLNTSLNPLNLSGDGFKQTYDQDINQPDRTIFQLGIIKIVLVYKAPPGPTHITFRLDPAASPRWSLDINNISFEVRVDGFGSDALLTFYGSFSASETAKPSVGNIQVQYGSALSFVEDIFSGLGPLIKAIGGEVDLDVAFSQNHLSVRDFLAVPTIPLGFGDIHDVVIDLGFDAVIPSNAAFHVGLGSKDKPFTWLVSPLSGTGSIVIGVDKGDIDVYVEGGIGAGLEINLAIASGAASITLELGIEIKGGNISVTVGLLGQASVDVLDGLASAALTLAASIAVTPEPLAFPPDKIGLTAAVAVGIHISICWVISIDFDGSWQFSQDISVDLPLI